MVDAASPRQHPISKSLAALAMGLTPPARGKPALRLKDRVMIYLENLILHSEK